LNPDLRKDTLLKFWNGNTNKKRERIKKISRTLSITTINFVIYRHSDPIIDDFVLQKQIKIM
jgi:hypothetical protein